MKQLNIEGQTVELDEDGFLANTEQWTPEIADAIAEREGLERIQTEKMKILLFLRDYFKKNHNFPILRYVCKKVHAESANCISEEFKNPMVAWKIAGLPKPPQIFFTSFDGKNFCANPFY